MSVTGAPQLVNISLESTPKLLSTVNGGEEKLPASNNTKEDKPVSVPSAIANRI